MSDQTIGLVSLAVLLYFLIVLRAWMYRTERNTARGRLEMFTEQDIPNLKAYGKRMCDRTNELQEKYNRLWVAADKIYMQGWWIQPGQDAPIGEHVGLWRDLMDALGRKPGLKVRDYKIAQKAIAETQQLVKEAKDFAEMRKRAWVGEPGQQTVWIDEYDTWMVVSQTELMLLRSIAANEANRRNRTEEVLDEINVSIEAVRGQEFAQFAGSTYEPRDLEYVGTVDAGSFNRFMQQNNIGKKPAKKVGRG